MRSNINLVTNTRGSEVRELSALAIDVVALSIAPKMNIVATLSFCKFSLFKADVNAMITIVR